MSNTRSSLRLTAFVFPFLWLFVSSSAGAQDQCESVLKYAGTDESIVSSEIQRVRKFISDFCSSSDTAQNSYSSSSQGVDVAFKGFGLGGSSSSDSQRLSQIKTKMCSDQQQASSDMEKYHREDRRATREAISAWETCMNRNGLAAKATVASSDAVIVTVSFRPSKTGETARVYPPYETGKSRRCEYIGNPQFSSQQAFDVGPAPVNFVCRRDKPSDAMAIVLSSETAFINGTNPVIQVEPYKTRIELPVPTGPAQQVVSMGATRFQGAFCSTGSAMPNMPPETRRLTCKQTAAQTVACAEVRSPIPSHPAFSDASANDPGMAFFAPPPMLLQAGPFGRILLTFEVVAAGVDGGSTASLRVIQGPPLPPGANGIRVLADGDSGFRFTEFVDGSGNVAGVMPFGPPVVWRKCS